MLKREESEIRRGDGIEEYRYLERMSDVMRLKNYISRSEMEGEIQGCDQKEESQSSGSTARHDSEI